MAKQIENIESNDSQIDSARSHEVDESTQPVPPTQSTLAPQSTSSTESKQQTPSIQSTDELVDSPIQSSEESKKSLAQSPEGPVDSPAISPENSNKSTEEPEESPAQLSAEQREPIARPPENQDQSTTQPIQASNLSAATSAKTADDPTKSTKPSTSDSSESARSAQSPENSDISPAPSTSILPPTTSPQEQAGDILLILDKEKMFLSALAKTDVDGKLKTVPATREHNNQFLRLNGSDNWFQAFATNFFSQAKDPTRFTLFKISDKHLDDPLVKRAMKDIEKGEITPDVVKFIQKYKVTSKQLQNNAFDKPDNSLHVNSPKSDNSQNTNLNNSKTMATQENQGPTTVEQQEPSLFRMHEAMIDWKQVEAHGITRDFLEQKSMFEPMLRRQKSSELVPIKVSIGGADSRYQARISFRQEDDGRIILQTHPLRQAPDFSKPFLGHNFSEDDKINLMRTGNMGRVVPLRTQTGYEDCFVSIDRMTNQIVSAKVDGALIANEYSGVTLSDHEKNELKEGRSVYIEGMTSKNGKEFNATLQYNAERRGVEYIFPQKLNLEHGQELGKVPLTNRQVDDYNAGKAIFVENMVSKKGEVFSSFIKRDDVSGRASYSRINPDDPSEVFVPSEINGVKITPEERQQLREGKEIFLNDMTNARGEEFSSYVKLDPGNGFPMYSKTIEGFEEKREFKIPQDVFGKTLTATQRADLQDGKAVLIEGMKGYDGQTFSQWAKINSQGNKLNYFNENPDVKRDATSRNVTQAAKQDKQATQKQTDSAERRKGRTHGMR